MNSRDAVERFARECAIEPDHIVRARQHALELGAAPISPAVGAQAAIVAAAGAARSIIEVGTGAGVSALWMLHGAPEATITTIDNEPEHLAAARESFQAARLQMTRVRTIAGGALEVLPRMNEASYDLVMIDADPGGVLEYLEHGLRLARPGGTVLFPRVLNGGRTADPVQRDAVTVGYRTLLAETAKTDSLLTSLFAGEEGMLQVVLR